MRVTSVPPEPIHPSPSDLQMLFHFHRTVGREDGQEQPMWRHFSWLYPAWNVFLGRHGVGAQALSKIKHLRLNSLFIDWSWALSTHVARHSQPASLSMQGKGTGNLEGLRVNGASGERGKLQEGLRCPVVWSTSGALGSIETRVSWEGFEAGWSPNVSGICL